MNREKIVSLVKLIPGLYTCANFVLVVYSIIKSKSIKTILFSPPGHYYSPLPNLKDVEQNTEILFNGDKVPLAIGMQKQKQIDLLRKFKLYSSEIPFPDKPTKTSRYYYSNRYFGDGDAIILYCMLRHFRPKNVVEIGSGFSSAVMLDTNEKFLNNEIKLTFIEPHSDRLIGLLTRLDQSNCKIIESAVQSVPLETFGDLDENDILFIDSSHVVKIGSDVAHIIFNILPTLKPGVIIHFHDILWPFEYPESWITQGISWNEAYFLRAFLQFNLSFEILFFNSYIASCHTEELQKNLPRNFQRTGGSLWLRKTT